MGGPAPVLGVPVGWFGRDGHVGVHEYAPGTQGRVDRTVENPLLVQGGNVVQGEGGGHRIAGGERTLERALGEPGSGRVRGKPLPRLVQHLRVRVDQLYLAALASLQYGQGQSAGAGAEVQHVPRLRGGNGTRRERNHLLVGGQEGGDGSVVGVDFDAEVRPYGMAHGRCPGLDR